MKKRPNPAWHMASWGAISGFILALFYLTVLIDIFSTPTDTTAILLLINPMAWWLSFVFGAVPGTIMGALVSIPLWGMLRDVPVPFTREHMQDERPKVYSITFLTTLALALWLIFIFFGSLQPGAFLVIPPFIAAIASTYVAHRYMWRLQLWSGGIEARKSKAKNDALAITRLQDPVEDDVVMPATDEQIRAEQRR